MAREWRTWDVVNMDVALNMKVAQIALTLWWGERDEGEEDGDVNEDERGTGALVG